MSSRTLMISIMLSLCVSATALNERALTPTSKKVVAQEDQEFNDAMAVWLKHRYIDGEKMFKEFAKKHPNSRWAASGRKACPDA